MVVKKILKIEGVEMITQEQKERYQYQQTEAGRNTLNLLEDLKLQYCRKLNIAPDRIRTGKLIPLVDGNTGKVDRFIEE
jgi:hypothetical protein